ncbi:hypothetical protein LCGC14_1682050 [marine sediment metagenome]|uniref:Uncharacterized protein n=1 Tax=marine sediment metagenome TaxID=412755 RepID=A0A0F9HNR3_9ZZZZ
MEPTTLLFILLAVIGIICITGLTLKYLNGDFDNTKVAKTAIEVAEDLAHKLDHVLTTHRLWTEEGTYTFPNGDTWHKDEVQKYLG